VTTNPSLRDSRLPQLALALDGEHIGAQLAACLARSGGGLGLLDCRLERFRYRPRERLVTLYEVHLQEGAGRHRWRHWLSGLMTADDRVVSQYHRLCRQAPARALGGLLDARPMLLEYPRLLLQHFPSDLKLKHLGELLGDLPKPLESFYRHDFGGDVAALGLAPPEPVRYRPQISAVLRQRGHHCADQRPPGEAWQVFLKLRADDDARASFARQRLLCDYDGPLGLMPARALAYIPELKLQVNQAVSGTTLVQRLIAGCQEGADWRLLGESLADFHCSEAPVSGVVNWESRLLRARACATLVEWACPSLQPLLRQLFGRLPGFRDGGLGRPCHGDLKPEHLFYGNGVIRVIDLEDAALSDPAFDIALLLAHMELLSVQGRASAGMLQASAGFLDVYRGRVPPAWARQLAPLYACAALDMARYCIQHQLSDWAQCSRYFCERALAALERPRWSFHDQLAPPVFGPAHPAISSDDDFLVSRRQSPPQCR
jgi:hypothetical protein